MLSAGLQSVSLGSWNWKLEELCPQTRQIIYLLLALTCSLSEVLFTELLVLNKVWHSQYNDDINLFTSFTGPAQIELTKQTTWLLHACTEVVYSFKRGLILRWNFLLIWYSRNCPSVNLIYMYLVYWLDFVGDMCFKFVPFAVSRWHWTSSYFLCRNELLTWFVKLQLAEYQQLFNESFEVSNNIILLCFLK